MKAEIEWIDASRKTPADLWTERGLGGWKVESIVEDYLAVLETDDPSDEKGVHIATYWGDIGWCYASDSRFKYDGNPWRVTWWAEKPKVP